VGGNGWDEAAGDLLSWKGWLFWEGRQRVLEIVVKVNPQSRGGGGVENDRWLGAAAAIMAHVHGPSATAALPRTAFPNLALTGER